jgi:hypothetical protein
VANDTMLFNAAVTSNADLSVAIGAVRQRLGRLAR